MSTLKADIEAIVNAIGDAISKTEALDAIDALVEKAVAELAALRASGKELEQLRALAARVDAIRNSIVGTQTVNWSAHIYPLVAALGDAGFKGEGYAVAHAKAKELIEQRDEAISRAEQAEAELAALKAQPSPWQDSFGNPVDVLFSVNAALARAGSPHRIDCLNGQAVTVPVPECLSSVQATPEPPSPSTVEEVTLRRCPAMSPKGATPSGEFPMDGAQCGMNEGHGGAHSLLIPTGFPWSSPSPEPASSYGQSRSMNKRLEIMGAPLPEGMVLNDAKDLVPSSSASALPENQERILRATPTEPRTVADQRAQDQAGSETA